MVTWECSVQVLPFGITLLLPKGSLWQACPPIGSLFWFCLLNSSIGIILLPKGRYLATLQTRSVTISIHPTTL